ncbi:MAG: hypothetical protein WD669_07590, partial [Pirellulales bacterium]
MVHKPGSLGRCAAFMMIRDSDNLTRRQFAAAAAALTLGAGRAVAQQPVITEPGEARELENLMNFLTKTAGGKQFWADLWFFHEWRIQRNALTGHYRLLDGANYRRASGTLEA